MLYNKSKGCNLLKLDCSLLFLITRISPPVPNKAITIETLSNTLTNEDGDNRG